MVNSKKASKSTIAIVLLSLLLVLSLILTATGAWFTDKATNDTGKTNIAFGKVDVGIEGTAKFTKNHTATEVVDGCSWTINGLSFTNGSTVDVYYAYNVTVKLLDSTGAEVTDSTVKGYFNIPDAVNGACKKLAAGGTIDPIENLEVEFDSQGEMNGQTATYQLQIIVNVAAVQADHNTAETAATQLAALLAGTFTQSAIA